MKKTLLLKTMLLLFGLIVGSSSVWAATVTFNYEDYKGKGTTSSGSEYTMEKSVVSIGGNKFFGNNSYAHFYANGTITITPADNIKITKIELTASSTSYNGYQSSGTVTPSTGSMSHDGTLVTWTGSATKEFTIENSKQIRWTSIVVTYEAVSSFTITAQSNNTEWGTVSGTTTITASPEDGYRVVAGDGGYTVTSGEATVVNNGDNTFSVIPTSDCTIQINFEAIPTHTVTWSINGTETSEDVAEGADITFPADPADVSGKTFVGWTETAIDGITDDAPTFVTSATMGTSDLKYYAVYATQSGSGENGWVETTLASLTATDVFVIVGDNGNTYAMTNEVSSQYPPSVSAVTISDGKITSDVADNIKWNISGNATDGYTFYPNGDDKNWLYCTNSNNGVRVGNTTSNNTFTIEEDYLHSANNRFLGIYNSQDWRCYTSINSNIKDQSFAFYKYVEGSCSGYCTSVPTTATATIPAGKEWITFCSTANLDFSEAIEGLKGAYTITAHESQAITLTATKMTGTVKAGTGLLLRAKTVSATDAQAINIPVAATGEEQAENMLKGVLVDTEIEPTTGDYTNLGLKDGEFHPYTNGPSDQAKLAAGKAYLQVPTAQMPTGGNNARLYIVLDGEATGINAIENSELRIENLDAPMYNLAGQRVTKSYKGVVIVNGKKYINK